MLSIYDTFKEGSPVNVRLVSEDANTVTIALDPVADAEAYALTVDGKTILSDGKRHVFYDPTIKRKIGKIKDGQPHEYGVVALVRGEAGSVTVPTPVTPPPDPQPTSGNPVPPPASGCYFGAYIEGGDTYGYYYPNEGPWDDAPWDTKTWDRFEQNAGKKIKLMMFGQSNWMSSSFPKDGLNAAHARGAIPVLDNMTGSTPLTDIINGKYDSQITAWAKQAAALSYPFVFRWNCEMNGTWYNYGAQARSNPSLYVNAWKHTHDLFKAAGANNVSWHWCPNVDPERVQTPLEKLYPGDDYVDWLGLTGYQEDAGETFDWCYSDSYSRLVALSKKPIMIGEISSYGQYRSTFVSDMFSKLPTKYPQVKGFCWFNWRIYEGGKYKDWPIEAAALSQFKQAVASSYYVGR